MINPEDLISTVYKVYTSTREGEKAEFCGVYETFKDAHKASTGKGGWTETGIVESAKGIVMDNKIFILEGPAPYYFTANLDIQKKAVDDIDNAISKLSKEDIETLKLDPDRLKKLAKNIESEEDSDTI